MTPPPTDDDDVVVVMVPAAEALDGAHQWQPAVDAAGNRLDLGQPARPALCRVLARKGDGRPQKLLKLEPPGKERRDIANRLCVNLRTTWWDASFECGDGRVRGAAIFNESDITDSWLCELSAADKLTLMRTIIVDKRHISH